MLHETEIIMANNEEFRRVPKNWVHPKGDDGKFIALFDGRTLKTKQREWDLLKAEWIKDGLSKKYGCSFVESEGERPSEKGFTPAFSDSEATHYMLYNIVTEGMPLSPALESEEAVIEWIKTNGAL